jgi:uncharacterized Zn finger protein
MIQIQRREQFTKAIERARKERMFVQPIAAREYSVTNRTKGNRYRVSFHVKEGKRFGHCNCAAGEPMHGNRQPMVCKHLLAALTLHLTLAAARRDH